MMILRFPASFSLAAALAMGALASPALAQPAAQVGTLSCDVSAGVGMILMQKQTMTCLFAKRRSLQLRRRPPH